MNIKSISAFLAKELTPQIDGEKLTKRIEQLLSAKGPSMQELIVRGLHGAASIQQNLKSFAIEDENSSRNIQGQAANFILRIPIIGLTLSEKQPSAIVFGANDPIPKQLAKALAG